MNKNKSPYDIIKRRHVTEKVSVLASLETSESNASVRKCNKPKVVFLVAPTATKIEIARAFEEIYKRRNVKVTAVNTIRVKPKRKRLRGRPGMTRLTKKAIITMRPGDSIEA